MSTPYAYAEKQREKRMATKRKTYQFVSDYAVVIITLDNNPSEDDAWEVLDEIVRNSKDFHLEELP